MSSESSACEVKERGMAQRKRKVDWSTEIWDNFVQEACKNKRHMNKSKRDDRQTTAYHMYSSYTMMQLQLQNSCVLHSMANLFLHMMG